MMCILRLLLLAIILFRFSALVCVCARIKRNRSNIVRLIHTDKRTCSRVSLIHSRFHSFRAQVIHVLFALPCYVQSCSRAASGVVSFFVLDEIVRSLGVVAASQNGRNCDMQTKSFLAESTYSAKSCTKMVRAMCNYVLQRCLLWHNIITQYRGNYTNKSSLLHAVYRWSTAEYLCGDMEM